MALITNLYSALAQGTLWGIMALGVYITFRILDIADLSCEWNICTRWMYQCNPYYKGSQSICNIIICTCRRNVSRTCYRLAAHETYDPCDLSRYFNNDRIMVR